MGQKDLGTCIIISIQDAEKLKINLNELEYLGDIEISPVKGLYDFEIKRKLRREIEKYAEEHGADMAVINKKDRTENFLTSINYGFRLYKYKS